MKKEEVKQLLEGVAKDFRLGFYPNKKAYGNQPSKEALYELEDNAVRLESEQEKFIPYYDMQDVMLKYSKSIDRSFKKLDKLIEEL